MPLESLWWSDNFDVFTSDFMKDKDKWLWTSMIHQPDFITVPFIVDNLEHFEK